MRNVVVVVLLVLLAVLWTGVPAHADQEDTVVRVYLLPSGLTTCLVESKAPLAPDLATPPYQPGPNNPGDAGYPYTVWLVSPTPLSGEGLMRTGSIDVDPLLARVNRPAFCVLSAVYSRHVEVQVRGQKVAPYQDGRTFIIPTENGPPGPISVTSGYPWVDFWPLGTALLLPMGVMWMVSRFTLTGDPDPTSAGYSFLRLQRVVTSLNLFVWWFALAVWGGKDLLEYLWRLQLVPPPMIALLLGCNALLFCPPWVTDLGCRLIAFPVDARLRGSRYTRDDVLRGWLLSTVADGVRWVLIVTAVGLFTSQETTQAGVCVLFVFLLRRLLKKVRTVSPARHASKELRERLMALAQTAGVTVTGIFVMASDKSQMSNAFAMLGNKVVLTDRLLQSLSPREVDAVMAHEFAHLKHRHGAVRVAIVVAFIALQYAIYRTLQISILDLQGLLVVVIVNVSFSVVLLMLSRRQETQADLGGLAILPDAEAAIKSLAKSALLNQMPWRWPALDMLMWTHPSTESRMERLARQSGLTPERVTELKQQAMEELVAKSN